MFDLRDGPRGLANWRPWIDGGKWNARQMQALAQRSRQLNLLLDCRILLGHTKQNVVYVLSFDSLYTCPGETLELAEKSDPVCLQCLLQYRVFVIRSKMKQCTTILMNDKDK